MSGTTGYLSLYMIINVDMYGNLTSDEYLECLVLNDSLLKFIYCTMHAICKVQWKYLRVTVNMRATEANSQSPSVKRYQQPISKSINYGRSDRMLSRNVMQMENSSFSMV